MSLPPILAARVTEDRAEFDLALPAELDVFHGHFPGRPILPGVAQIDWVAALATRVGWLTQPVMRDFKVKFRGVIVPGEPVTLRLRIERDKRRLDFEYCRGGQVLSSGRARLPEAA